MKRISFIILSSLLVLASAGCEKNDQNNTDGCVQVKVLDAICNSAVLQILDPDYYYLGVNGYQKDGITYDHVFTTVFPCKLPDSSYSGRPNQGLADKPYYVKIIDQPEPNDPNCVTCAAVVTNAPNKFLYISVSQECNSN